MLEVTHWNKPIQWSMSIISLTKVTPTNFKIKGNRYLFSERRPKYLCLNVSNDEVPRAHNIRDMSWESPLLHSLRQRKIYINENYKTEEWASIHFPMYFCSKKHNTNTDIHIQVCTLIFMNVYAHLTICEHILEIELADLCLKDHCRNVSNKLKNGSIHVKSRT
jgi:hypothetical protein